MGWFFALLFAALAFWSWAFQPHEPSWPSYADTFTHVAQGVVNVSLESAETRVGSGFAISSNRIVTARHLVLATGELTVRDVSGRTLNAVVVGTDARTDLALLEVAGGEFVPAVLGESNHLRVGDTVLAIGNPYGLGHSLAVGVVGHRGRRLVHKADGPRVDFIQLSIPLNPGNSGGPIFDVWGKVVGVLAGTHSEGQAIAFAVPIEVLLESLPALKQGERVSRAFLGVRTEQEGGSVV
ncbi:MAG: trypsin-like serine protease, partial [Proteobacteria bacterium]|nr:trypsin-like serine protease [Pseudomonadota bacterium]